MLTVVSLPHASQSTHSIIYTCSVLVFSMWLTAPRQQGQWWTSYYPWTLVEVSSHNRCSVNIHWKNVVIKPCRGLKLMNTLLPTEKSIDLSRIRIAKWVSVQKWIGDNHFFLQRNGFAVEMISCLQICSLLFFHRNRSSDFLLSPLSLKQQQQQQKTCPNILCSQMRSGFG